MIRSPYWTGGKSGTRDKARWWGKGREGEKNLSLFLSRFLSHSSLIFYPSNLLALHMLSEPSLADQGSRNFLWVLQGTSLR